MFWRAAVVASLGAAAHASTCVETTGDFQSRAFDSIEGVELEPDTAYTVRQIRMIRQDLFDLTDPTEQNAIFRTANRFHKKSRESTVRQVILFEVGGQATPQLLEESERLLRRKSYVYDARVVASRMCQGETSTIDVVIVIRDVWAWLPNLGLTRTGGDERLEIGVTNINLGGRGKHLDLAYFDNLDRDGVAIGYLDPNVGTTRIALRTAFSRTSDGERRVLGVGQPFYSLDARSAWNVAYDRASRLSYLYDQSETTAQFRQIREFATVSRGWSAGLHSRFVTRWSTGYTFDRHDFSEVEGLTDGPPSRRFSYPWMSIEHIENEFEESRNEDGILSTEDVFLGWRGQALLGLSSPFSGDSRGTHVIFDGSLQDGIRSGPHLARYGGSVAGAWRRGEPENVIADLWLRYRLRQSDRRGLFVRLNATRLIGATEDSQLLLGGGSGLRGYPNRYQAGDRRVVGSIEQRFFSDLHLFHVLRVASAVFVDIGRSWSRDGPTGPGRETLLNVGVGLRLQSTKTTRDRIYHIDLAFPLRDGPLVNGIEFTLTSRRAL